MPDVQEILDDEHWNRPISGDDEGTLDTSLRVDQVIAALPHEREPITLEDSNERLVRDGTDLRQSDTHRHPVQRDEFRRVPSVPVLLVARLFEDVGGFPSPQRFRETRGRPL
jgi:hypothetical protein